ncbi:hypothetical protein D187_000280 [Cystobacter fuscus DSM 2262]|uniref:Protein kinase n=1 Tax=Cystobacter fuscus (strain ATCC 25194 / DSM 2262 / NBRC 100088 / M29) TaxID=1242864 RepID=S9R743_CYSF2|nr:hypothetical protein D187_000280 [Cystobacter fuscus DSM 2262]
MLLLRPDKRVDWQLEAGWRVSLSTHRRPPFVKLVVHRAPTRGRTTKLTDLFVLFAAAFQRVEDDALMDTHLRSGRKSELKPVSGRVRTSSPGWGLAVTALALLSLGAGFWLRGLRDTSGLEAQTSLNQWTNSAGQGSSPIAYPMPKKPWPDQATAPCGPVEVEINGGCWLTLEHRPPCVRESHAEYQGRCYFPVGKKKATRPPQSVEP